MKKSNKITKSNGVFYGWFLLYDRVIIRVLCLNKMATLSYKFATNQKMDGYMDEKI